MPTALVTGGAGFIGSHTACVLLDEGWDVIIVDDLSNSNEVAIDRVRSLTRRQISFHYGEIGDEQLLARVFAETPVDAVVHFAGRKAVAESVAQPLLYFRRNVAGTIALLESMQAAGVRRLIFSSSCTVYGEPDPDDVPVTEETPLRAPASPYGRTKVMIEEILRDLVDSDPRWQVLLLRYFNPVGAHPTGDIGEDPKGEPNNLMPIVMQVAVGVRERVKVYGNDYPTRDGTCIRDYIHVMDLAEGHVAALRALPKTTGCRAVNLGTGTGSTVLEVVHAASAVVGRPIPHEIAPRRPGDVSAVWADVSLAREALGWEAKRGLEEMCADHYRWQRRNPHGYH